MKVAIVGFGAAGEARLAAYRSVHNGDVVAVVDPSRDRRARATELDSNLRVAESLADLLDRGSLEAVDICAPPAYHSELSTMALTAGCHVICEKPVAFRAADAEALVTCALKHRRLLYPAHNYGFSPMMRLLRDAIGDGTVGSPMNAAIAIERPTHARGVGSWQPDWRRDPAVAGGGILLDHGTHCVYMATRLFGGPPSKVFCSAQWAGDDEAAGIDEAVEVRLEFGTGVCTIDLSWTSEARSNLYQLTGPAGSVTIRDGAAVLERSGRRLTRSLTSPTGSSTHEEWFADLFADFSKTTATPDQWDRPHGEILSTARILDAAYRSAGLNGQPVSVATG